MRNTRRVSPEKLVSLQLVCISDLATVKFVEITLCFWCILQEARCSGFIISVSVAIKK